MAKRIAKRVLLVGWSGDWNLCRPLLDAGLMPNLRRLAENGAGGELTAVTPLLSAPAWTTIATAKRPFKHGILGLFEADEDVGGARPASSESRTAKAVWNILTEAGLNVHVVGWPGANPAEAISGVNVTDQYMAARVELGKPWAPPDGSVYPAELHTELASLRLHPEEIDCETLKFFVPAVETLSLGESGRLKPLRRWLAASITNHAVGTYVMERRPWDFMAVCYAGMERLLEAYLPFMPPRQPFVADREYELLHNIITASYQFHDMMLGSLLEIAGEEAIVIVASPYGWKSGAARARRPQAEPEDVESARRPRGLIVARGGAIKPGSTLHAASVMDVTPTVLALFGLPVGSDMDGRPLEALIGGDAEGAVERIESWDVSNSDGEERAADDARGVRLQAVIQQLAELGYRDPQEDRLAAEQQRAVRRNKLNLARSLMEGGQLEPAIEVLQQLIAAPTPNSFAMSLLMEAYLSAGNYEAASSVVEQLQAATGKESSVELSLGRIALGRGDAAAAIELLERASALAPSDPRVWLFLGRAHLALGEAIAARGAFEQAVVLDPDRRDAREELAALNDPGD